jgi:DNA-binding transcriptional ArsR family regulator
MANVFAVLADPTRRRMLEELRRGERSVNELVDSVDIRQPGVSRHLKIMRDAGLVTVRRQAQRRLYALRTEPLRDVDAWLARYRELWEQRLDRLDRHIKKQRRKRE